MSKMASKARTVPAKRQKLCHQSDTQVTDIEDSGQFSSSQAADIRTKLLAWYDHNHRILPWRRNAHSKVLAADEETYVGVSDSLTQQEFIYYVWVSEVMSQQTQVPRAAQYFVKWIQKWPNVKALAAASIEEVNEVWAGLGYYRRARFLLDGAKYVVEQQGGVFPTTSSELLAIPGVGSYTSSAIASIACGESIAVIDANVIRILARLKCLSWDTKNGKAYTSIANQLVDPTRPGDFNQAVMELGAKICTIHQAPSCAMCPIQDHCLAYQRVKQGGSLEHVPSVMDYPIKAEKTKRREETAAVCIIEAKVIGESSSHLLFVKRPADGLLAGLWEMPLQIVDKESSKEGRLDVMNTYLEDALQLPMTTLSVKSRNSLGQIVHIFSHIRLTLEVEVMCIEGKTLPKLALGSGVPEMKWISRKNLQPETFSSSVKKVLALLEKTQGRERKSIKRFFGSA